MSALSAQVFIAFRTCSSFLSNCSISFSFMFITFPFLIIRYYIFRIKSIGKMHKHFAEKLLNLPIDTKFRPGRQFTAGPLYHTFSRLSIGKIAKKIALMRERFDKFDEWQLQQNPASFRREICHFSQTRRFPFPAIFGGSCPQNAEYYT